MSNVVFTCQGDAADVTYGSDSNNIQGVVPMNRTLPLDPSAEYYAISAQLNGGGSVTCAVTVNDDGTPTTKTGSATGGYNIAQAEICSSFDGGWDPC